MVSKEGTDGGVPLSAGSRMRCWGNRCWGNRRWRQKSRWAMCVSTCCDGLAVIRSRAWRTLHLKSVGAVKEVRQWAGKRNG
ncbi:unnamed protein product [Lasius platythorax]|uniref:Uncharacterized protein n=1 Tax=Lasius platythorax TaxID=488582 RepID=A0AAV2MX39_9HYME